MKKAKLLLYLASLFIFIHMVGHFIGHSSWKTPKDPNMQKVVNAMVENKANYMGALRSLADFYHGFSLILFVLYILSIWILLVLVNNLRRNDLRLVKNILFPLGLAYTLFGIIEFYQFFPFAAIISTLAGLSIFGAMFFLRKTY
jgi:hypothetical protein